MKCKFCNTTVEKPTFDIGNTAISNDLITEEQQSELDELERLTRPDKPTS